MREGMNNKDQTRPNSGDEFLLRELLNPIWDKLAYPSFFSLQCFDAYIISPLLKTNADVIFGIEISEDGRKVSVYYRDRYEMYPDLGLVPRSDGDWSFTLADPKCVEDVQAKMIEIIDSFTP
jgi:hypothetical protein